MFWRLQNDVLTFCAQCACQKKGHSCCVTVLILNTSQRMGPGLVTHLVLRQPLFRLKIVECSLSSMFHWNKDNGWRKWNLERLNPCIMNFGEIANYSKWTSQIGIDDLDKLDLQAVDLSPDAWHTSKSRLPWFWCQHHTSSSNSFRESLRLPFINCSLRHEGKIWNWWGEDVVVTRRQWHEPFVVILVWEKLSRRTLLSARCEGRPTNWKVASLRNSCLTQTSSFLRVTQLFLNTYSCILKSQKQITFWKTKHLGLWCNRHCRLPIALQVKATNSQRCWCLQWHVLLWSCALLCKLSSHWKTERKIKGNKTADTPVWENWLQPPFEQKGICRQ